MTAPIRPEWHETALNRRTTRKHDRCVARGGCKPSDTYIWRDGQLVPECVRCAVPLLKRVTVWGSAA